MSIGVTHIIDAYSLNLSYGIFKSLFLYTYQQPSFVEITATVIVKKVYRYILLEIEC